ncbi:MAG: CoA transferase [Chloroflexi bacterium]|nr:CoA transferase [Chloroflexota bacterium]MCY3696076.1 CoA transferase [Chloroflexota bacterium]
MTTNPSHGMMALDDLRVLEIGDERGAWCMKLMADMGADVIKIEPPEGDPSRQYEPFVDDEPHHERSLFFWYYNTSKRSIVMDFDDRSNADTFLKLVSTADVILDTNTYDPVGRLGVDYQQIMSDNPGLIWCTITNFGFGSSRDDEPQTDLTLAANGGFAWMNGYDDHSLPPVRGGGQQAYHTGSNYAFMSILTALLHRDATGVGQHINVNINGSVNVTTEAGSYSWLVSHSTVQRQTGRHAGVAPSMPSQIKCADGRYVNTGIPPRRPAEFGLCYRWLEDEGLLDQLPEAALLLVGAELESFSLADVFRGDNEELLAIFGAGRAAFDLLASKLTAYEFFTKAQNFGFQVGVIHSPEEALEDPHFVDRGMQVKVAHPELGRDVIYPGAPYQLTKGSWGITRRPPLLGEHTDEVLSELD